MGPRGARERSARALDAVVAVNTAVAMISAGVGTSTLIPTWRQSPWNNILYKPRGPDVTLYSKNTLETWDAVFKNIAIDVGQLL